LTPLGALISSHTLGSLDHGPRRPIGKLVSSKTKTTSAAPLQSQPGKPRQSAAQAMPWASERGKTSPNSDRAAKSLSSLRQEGFQPPEVAATPGSGRGRGRQPDQVGGGGKGRNHAHPNPSHDPMESRSKALCRPEPEWTPGSFVQVSRDLGKHQPGSFATRAENKNLRVGTSAIVQQCDPHDPSCFQSTSSDLQPHSPNAFATRAKNRTLDVGSKVIVSEPTRLRGSKVFDAVVSHDLKRHSPESFPRRAPNATLHRGTNALPYAAVL